MEPQQVIFNPIGIFHTQQVHPYEAGRQPDDHHSEGYIELYPGQNFEQALVGLEQCPRVWVIFQFHHNQEWKPMVLPPRGRNTKLGVFATRSPYRPNSIGMSCVRITKIEKLKIHIAGADLLDGSPIFDIKPYVAYADSFPAIEPGWLKEAKSYQINFSETSLKQLNWLESKGITQLRSFLLHQLEYEPTNSKKKRVKPKDGNFIIAYRTWRVEFSLIQQEVRILKIVSGYSPAELNSPTDTYGDKQLHLDFEAQEDWKL